MTADIFNYPIDDYQQDIDPVKHYLRQVSLYVSKVNHIPFDEAMVLIEDDFKHKRGVFSRVTDRAIVYARRKKNSDREVVEDSFLRYIQNFTSNNSIVAPTLTTYDPHEVKQALSVPFVQGNKKDRSVAKKLKFKYEVEGKVQESRYQDKVQSNMKLLNNAFSGAYSSPYTSLYFKTGHNTLTSATRVTTSNSNSLNEKLLTGNRHYYSVSIILANITFIISKINRSGMVSIIEKYHLYLPTVEDCLSVIERSAKLYCLYHYEDPCKQLLATLDDIERAWFVYANDLYHLCIYNPDFMKSVFQEAIQLKEGDREYTVSEIYKIPEEYLHVAKQICYDYTKGMGHKYEKMQELGTLKHFGATAQNVVDSVQKYADFWSTVFRNDVIPHSVAFFPFSLRRCVLTSDTDSTIPTYQELIFWYLGKEEFSQTGKNLQAFLVLISGFVTSHVLIQMSTQFNTSKSLRKEISMKNEYTMDSYVITSMAKHYYASISVQEGNVFSQLKREYKGAHLVSSNNSQWIRDDVKVFMNKIMDASMANEKLSMQDLLSHVYRVEQDIIESINTGKMTYFKMYKVKGAESYKPHLFSVYKYYLLWNKVYGDQYAHIETCPYAAIKLSLTTTTAQRFNEWLASLNPITQAKWNDWLTETKRTELSMVMLPFEIIRSYGLPNDLLRIIDYQSMVGELCKAYYTILETVGFFIKDGCIVSDYMRK